MAKSSSNKKDSDNRSRTQTPAPASPSRSSSSSSRASTSSSAARDAANAAQARAFQEAKAISEQRQRDIEDVRNRTEHTLSRTPANLRKQVIDTVTHIEATKPQQTKPQQIGRNRLRDAARKQARTHKLGALTDTKPARDARRSPEKVRAIIKCKSRPKNNKSPRRGGGGGGRKRFIPWC